MNKMVGFGINYDFDIDKDIEKGMKKHHDVLFETVLPLEHQKDTHPTFHLLRLVDEIAPESHKIVEEFFYVIPPGKAKTAYIVRVLIDENIKYLGAEPEPSYDSIELATFWDDVMTCFEGYSSEIFLDFVKKSPFVNRLSYNDEVDEW